MSGPRREDEMKNAYAYIACFRENDEGMCWAFSCKLSSHTNVISQLKELGMGGNLKVVQLCATLSEARELAERWNNCFRENGKYGYFA